MSHRTEAVRQGEAALTKSLPRLLKAAGKQAARVASKAFAALGKASDQEDVADDAIAGVDWAHIAESGMAQIVAVASDGARQAIEALGVEVDAEQVDDAAVEWATNRAAELVGMQWQDGELVANENAEYAITESLRVDIREAVAAAIEGGDSAANLADAIEGLAGFSPERAELIARSEIVNANNQSHLIAFRASGVVTKKGWSTSNEESVCEICAANEEQGAIGIDDEFSSGDQCPIAHPRCMCVLIAQFDADDAEEETEDVAAE